MAERVSSRFFRLVIADHVWEFSLFTLSNKVGFEKSRSEKRERERCRRRRSYHMWPSMCRVPIHPFKENRPFRNFFVPRHSGPCSGSGLLFILFLKEEHSMMLTEQVFFSIRWSSSSYSLILILRFSSLWSSGCV